MNIIPHPPPTHTQILHVPKFRPSIFCLFCLLFNLLYVFDFVYEFLLVPMKTEMENLMTEASASPSSSPSCWLRHFKKHLKHRDASKLELSAFHASLSVSLLFFHNACFLGITLKPTFAGASFEISLPNRSNASTSFSSFLSLSSSVNTRSCCWGSDLYQGKLHLIQVTPYTYRAAFLLFSICYASPLRAWSVRLGNLIQVAQHHA